MVTRAHAPRQVAKRAKQACRPPRPAALDELRPSAGTLPFMQAPPEPAVDADADAGGSSSGQDEGAGVGLPASNGHSHFDGQPRPQSSRPQSASGRFNRTNLDIR